MRRLEFASLHVRDLEVSKAFYTEKLGFELSEATNPQACIFKYNKGEASFAIRKPIVDFEGKEPGIGVSIWFAVEETMEDMQTKLKEKGVATKGNITATPFGKTLVVTDPDGYNITFLEQNS